MPSTAQSHFKVFEPRIRELFAGILTESGYANPVSFKIVDAEDIVGTRANAARAIFEAVVPDGPISITWDGLASLWFCCFGCTRVGQRLFEERRRDVERLQIDEPLRHGLAAFAISQGLTRMPLGNWSDKLPLPDAAPTPSSENESVTKVFLGALGWILRHELAHIVLKHQETDTADRMKEDEFAADAQASRWMCGDRKKDEGREAGARPSQTELELEGLALAMGIGLMWVALFEEHHARKSTDHPEIAERFNRCARIFDLAKDSGAAEILSDTFKTWLDPEGAWITSRDPEVATAEAAMDEALFRLQRHMQARHGQ